MHMHVPYIMTNNNIVKLIYLNIIPTLLSWISIQQEAAVTVMSGVFCCSCRGPAMIYTIA